MYYHGRPIPSGVNSPEINMVIDFLERKQLSKMGVTQDYDSISDFERMYLTYCGTKFIELENKEREKSLKKRK